MTSLSSICARFCLLASASNLDLTLLFILFSCTHDPKLIADSVRGDSKRFFLGFFVLLHLRVHSKGMFVVTVVGFVSTRLRHLAPFDLRPGGGAGAAGRSAFSVPIPSAATPNDSFSAFFGCAFGHMSVSFPFFRPPVHLHSSILLNSCLQM